MTWQPLSTYKGGRAFLLYPDGCIGLGDQRDLEGEPPRMLPLYWMPCPELPFTPEEWRVFKARNEACGVMQPAAPSGEIAELQKEWDEASAILESIGCGPLPGATPSD